MRLRRSAMLLTALACAVLIQTASAAPTAVIDGATAAGLCTTSYPGTTGPDQLSPCQWDMPVIDAGGAHAHGDR